MKQAQNPTLAFLGVCDRAARVKNVDSRLTALNLIGLRQEVVAPFFPLPTAGLHLLFALYDPLADLPRVVVVRKPDSLDQLFRFEINLELPPTDEVPDDPLEYDRGQLTGSWNSFVLDFPEEAPMIEAPGGYSVVQLRGDTEISIGAIAFYHAPPPSLTDDVIKAIQADPQAAKSVVIHLGCKACKDGIDVYAALERIPEKEQKGWIWHQTAPESFSCTCGKANIPLSLLRDGLHAALGRRILGLAEPHYLAVTRLYERSTLQTTLAKFEHLLDAEPDEELVQQFMTDNPILFHRFSPDRIFSKAPVLTKHQTDFAVHSTSGELILIEIEKPGKKVLKKDGGRTANFTHALGQVDDWLYLVDEHRLAALEMMGLDHTTVAAIRGVVVMGRDQANRADHLRKLKSADFGRTTFLTFDDILSGLASLVRDFEKC